MADTTRRNRTMKANTETITMAEICNDVIRTYEELSPGLIEVICMECLCMLSEQSDAYQHMWKWIDSNMIDWDYIYKTIN